jgi:hypothetical protein
MAIFNGYNNYNRQQGDWQFNQNNRQQRPGYFQNHTAPGYANRAPYGRPPMIPNPMNSGGGGGQTGSWLDSLMREGNQWLRNLLGGNSQWQNSRPLSNQPQQLMNAPMQGNRQQPMNAPMQGNRQQPMNTPMQGNRQQQRMNSPMQGNRQQQPMNAPMQGNRQQQPMNAPMQGNRQQQPGNTQSRQSPQQPAVPQPIPPEISFEPINEDMMKMIQKNMPATQIATPAQIQALSPEAPAAAPSDNNLSAAPLPKDSFPADDADYAAKLGDFIQSEKNAAAFYRHLSELSNSNIHRELFNKISEEDDLLSDRYNDIYHGHKGARFETQSAAAPFVSSLPFAEGVKIAIQEEYKAIDDLTAFYEQVQDGQNRAHYNTVRAKKMRDIDLMHAVLADM